MTDDTYNDLHALPIEVVSGQDSDSVAEPAAVMTVIFDLLYESRRNRWVDLLSRFSRFLSTRSGLHAHCLDR